MYRIKFKDMEIHVDNENEFRSVLAAINTHVEDNGQPDISDNVPNKGRSNLETIQDSLDMFFRRIHKTPQHTVLFELSKHPDGRTDSDLRKLLNLPDNKALAGIMGGISKNASACGLDVSLIITKEMTIEPDGRRYDYRIGPLAEKEL